MNGDNLSLDDLQTYHLRRRSGREKRVMEADDGEPIRKRGDHETYWSTESEKNHIDGIGTHGYESKRRRTDPEERRLKLLLNYRKAIFERKVWETIDPTEILLYIERKIMKEKIFKEMYGRISEENG